MTRSQSEAIANTIIAAVAPLATKADLKSHKEATKADLDFLKEQMATKTDIANLNTSIESVKVWLLVILLGLVGSLLAVAFSITFDLLSVGVGG